MRLFDKIRLARAINQAYQQMDLSKLKSVKLWTAGAANAAIAFLGMFFGLDPDTAGQLIALVSGGYLASQGMADWSKGRLEQVRGNLGSRKLWLTFGSSVLIGLLTQFGLEQETAAKLIGMMATLFLGAQGMADFGKEKAIASVTPPFVSLPEWPEKEIAGDR